MNHFFGRHWRSALLLAWVSGIASVQAELSFEQIQRLPPPAGHSIEFEKEIRPVLESRCLQCHARGKAKGGFSLESREKLLKGGDSGPAIIPGNSAGSLFTELVSGLNPDSVMPLKGTRLTAEQVGLIRAWIDQGAPWEHQTSFQRPLPKNLMFGAELKAWLAANGAVTNPIDPIINDYFAQTGFNPPSVVSDRIYARRVYLDTIGLLPTPEQIDDFIKDPRPDKRFRLVEALLQDNTAYAEHWLSFWNDLLRNDYAGTGYIDEGRKQISGWLYEALLRNQPFDGFVKQLIYPDASSEGFLKGIIWRGAVNASQSVPMQAAQGVSQVFLGINLKCASCHDSFVSDWALSDAYGMASVFSDAPLELVQCDKPLGRLAAVRFLYPELGSFDAGMDRADRLKRLSEIMTSPNNGRLAMTIVNRLWERTMGRGLVEPVDDLERNAWDPKLLQVLAIDLVQNGYNLKRTLTLILTSQAYQLPAVDMTASPDTVYTFTGPLIRRLSAEQFSDAISMLTGRGGGLPGAYETIPTDFALLDELLNLQQEPHWIWAEDPEAEKAYFRKSFYLDHLPSHAAAFVTASQSYTFFANGKEVSSSGEFGKIKLVDLTPHLKAGNNLLAISARKARRSANPEAPFDLPSTGSGPSKPDRKSPPTGIICYVRVAGNSSEEEASVTTLVSDRTWACQIHETDGWQTGNAYFDPEQKAREYGLYAHPAWDLESKLNRAMAALSKQNHFRAGLMKNDPLQAALGRPNREQIVTTRNGQASTLQMLELSNGKILSQLLAEGGRYWMARGGESHDLMRAIFQAALSRDPTPEEDLFGLEMLGDDVTGAEIADLLWAVVMLPEFQFIP